MSHQILVGIVADADLGHVGQEALPVGMAVEGLGDARARQIAEDGRPERLEPGILPFPERRGGAQRQEMGEEVGRLVHQVDAQLDVLDPGMDVHAADHEPARQGLEVLGQDAIAVEVDAFLLPPARRGMGRDGEQRQIEIGCTVGDRPPEPGELLAQLADVAADRRPDLDLRLEQLMGDLGAERLAAGAHEAGRRADGELARGALDDQVLLLYPKGEMWPAWRHARSPPVVGRLSPSKML
jgi:hypothetical protein